MAILAVKSHAGGGKHKLRLESTKITVNLIIKKKIVKMLNFNVNEKKNWYFF